MAKHVYYLDESGNTGDLVRTGDRLDFESQPIFVLVCLELLDETGLEREVERLRAVHKIQPGELKSKNLRTKPRLVSDLARYMVENNIPLFIEVVEKRYFLCIHLLQSLILPTVGAVDQDAESMWLRNIFAEHLRMTLPMNVMEDFAYACNNPSIDSVQLAFRSSISFLQQRPPGDQAAQAMLHSTEEACGDFEEMALTDGIAWTPFLPVPDVGKRGKQFWMLPNLSSFTNIYARINQFTGQDVDGITFIHDEQLQFDEIIEHNKKRMEGLFRETSLPLLTSNYAVKQAASLVFQPSHGCIGVQAADVIAGFVMRYVQDRLSKKTELSTQHEQAFANLSLLRNPVLGLGINYVLSDRHMWFLGLRPTSNLALDFIPPEVPGFPTEDDAEC